ncbi:hypothetical protein CAL7716_105100 (plasmid) [Calothrix sp. PCC 7716]|nr:hypothetical protein CAL7716_105100 [Calothrix sp. PCC 7716]
MPNQIQELSQEITSLKSQLDNLILYWFEKGEKDYSLNSQPQYPDNQWYMSGYNDKEYQLEIDSSFNLN